MRKVIPFPKSTSPKPDHFDKQTPKAIIMCRSCKEPLWEMEVRGANGTVVSSSTKCVGRNTTELKKDTQDCPLCHKPFAPKGKVSLRSVITGQTFSY